MPIVPIGIDNGNIGWKKKEVKRMFPAIDKVLVMYSF